MQHKKLSNKEQAAGRRYFSLFNIFNAVSFGCLGDNMLYLFALALGSPPYVVTILGSLLFLSNLGMPLGKNMVTRYGATGTLWRCWTLRNFAGLIMAGAPLAAKISPPLGIATLLLGAVIFYTSRSAGIVTIQAIYHEITTPKNCGSYIATIFQNFSIFLLLTIATIALVMRRYSSIAVYQTLLVIGVIAGLIAAWFVAKLKETQTPRLSSRQPIITAWRDVWSESRLRRLLFANCVAYSIAATTAPVSLLALKKIYAVSDENAMLFILIQMSGTIAVSYISKIVSAHSGPRPLVILYYSALIVVSLLWIVAPHHFNWFYAAIIFFLVGLGGMGIPLSLTHYFQNAVPPQKSVSISLVIAIAAGVCAGAAGGIISSSLMKLLPTFYLNQYAIYRNYFILNAGFALFGLTVIISLHKIKDWEVKEVIARFFAPRDIRTMMLLNKMNDELVTVESEKEKIKKLSQLRSELSEHELLKFLDSPKYELRYMAVWSLLNIPLSRRGEERLIRELKEGIFSTANIAAHIVGIKGISTAIPALKEALHSEDIDLRGNAMVALTRLQATESYPEIIKLFLDADKPRLLVSGATALSNIGSVAAISALLTQANAAHLPLPARREIIIAVAQLGQIGSEVYKFLKPDDENKNELDLFENISNSDDDDEWLKQLQPLLDKPGNEHELLNFLSHTVKNITIPRDGLSTQRLGKNRQRKTLFNAKNITGTAVSPAHQAALHQAITAFCDEAMKQCNRELVISLLAICYRMRLSTISRKEGEIC